MLERRLRLWSGLILTVYVIPHLINHAFGIISIDAMETVRGFLTLIWSNSVGGVLLYGSILVHLGLALLALFRRTTLRMPAWEAVQIAMGLLIPPLLMTHMIGTRLVRELVGIDITYSYVVAAIWFDSWMVAKQTAVLLVVWIHMAVGLHFWLRLKPWYGGSVRYLYPVAVLIPVLALLGFARAGFEVAARAAREPGWVESLFVKVFAAPEDIKAIIFGLEPMLFAVVGGALAVVLAGRIAVRVYHARRGRFRLSLPSGRVVTGTAGQTMLEALRVAGVPHASICGGRGRCTTCRVRVDPVYALPPAEATEHQALARIDAAASVRLACQVRPAADVFIEPLLPAMATVREAQRPGGVNGREQAVAVMFIDLRGSTKLGEQRMPYDVLFILNQFFAEMAEALRLTDGHYAQFNGDGLMALYGLDTGIEVGSRQAFAGAAAMAAHMNALNRRLEKEVSEPLRIGIGIHCGEAIVGTMGPPRTPILSAIGDSINIAARLEAMTKDLGCMRVASAAAVEAARLDLSDTPTHETAVRGRDEPITVYAINDPADVPGIAVPGGI
jgi:adenylate cyclase